MKKIRLGILFGGQSAEHEISLQSAKNIVDAIDRSKYDLTLIGIDRDGLWYQSTPSTALPGNTATGLTIDSGTASTLSVVPGKNKTQMIATDPEKSILNETGALDVVFPILHGPQGEDGTVQGLLRLANIPFVGSDVLGSAVSMDKDVMKRLLAQADLPIGRYRVYRAHQRPQINYQDIVQTFSLPLYVKPANMGSSVGVSKVKHAEELEAAINTAFEYDQKILIEENIQGREIEVAVLGNDQPRASIAGEIIPVDGFYSFNAKYLDEKGAQLQIPAKLTTDQLSRLQDLAVRVFQTLECSGFARVDFFLTEDDQIFVNELNSIPGFTKISMFPRLWEASGIGYSALIDQLITLAMERH